MIRTLPRPDGSIGFEWRVDRELDERRQADAAGAAMLAAIGIAATDGWTPAVVARAAGTIAPILARVVADGASLALVIGAAATRLTEEVRAGLAADLAHRDVKPENERAQRAASLVAVAAALERLPRTEALRVGAVLAVQDRAGLLAVGAVAANIHAGTCSCPRFGSGPQCPTCQTLEIRRMTAGATPIVDAGGKPRRA